MLPAEHTRILYMLVVYLRVRGRLKTPDNQVRRVPQGRRAVLSRPRAPPGGIMTT